MNFLNLILAHLNLIPPIANAVQVFQNIGHSKETTIQKVGDIIKTAATVGEQIPVPVVEAISATVETVAEAVFATPPGATPAPAPLPAPVAGPVATPNQGSTTPIFDAAVNPAKPPAQ